MVFYPVVNLALIWFENKYQSSYYVGYIQTFGNQPYVVQKMRSNLKWYIYCIYGVLSGSIRQFSRLYLGFFRPRSRNALGQHAVPSGLRPSGTARCPRAFINLGRKKPRFRGYCRIDPTNTLHIYILTNFHQTFYLFLNLMISWEVGGH